MSTAVDDGQVWQKRDYTITGEGARAAARRGLVAAQWYHSDIPRPVIKALMRRENARPLRDQAIWLAVFAVSGFGTVWFWGSGFAVPFFVVYGMLYASSNDSRWHECGHGTAFKTPWINDVIYHVASFAMVREPTLWRWMHARHHTDTLIVGRDPGIVAQRPPDLFGLVVNLFNLKQLPVVVWGVVRHAFGNLNAEEMDYTPPAERRHVIREARIWLAIYVLIVAAAVALHSWLPVLLVGPVVSIYGYWWAHLAGLTQHAGLAEDVLDHRLNSRTVYMNPVWRFLYLNMNYHVEHHMFPMVPYYNLPELHRLIKADCPPPCTSTWAAFREIIPTVLRQSRTPEYFLRRTLPPTAKPFRPELHELTNMSQ